MNRAPIRGHESLETHFFSEKFLQRAGISTRISSVDLVVGAHDGRNSCAHSRRKGRGEHLMKGLFVNEDITSICVIPDEVLDLRHHALLLDPGNLFRTEFTRQKWILPKGVVTALKAKISVDIDEWL